MVELRRATREVPGPAGAPLYGRGYEVHDADGVVLANEQLEPGAFTEIVLVDVAPASGDERQALRTAAFGVGRPVTLRPEGEGIGVHDADGTVRAGWVDAGAVEATRALLDREHDVATWVCWEWLQEDGRSGLRVALSRPDLAPRRLAPPPQTHGVSARALLSDRRVWLGIAALVVVALVAFAAAT